MIVHNKGDLVRHIGVRLLPGANKLLAFQEAAFNQASEHKLNKFLIDSGEIEVVGNEKKEKADSFSDLNADKAIALASDTFELSVLDVFLKEEADGKNRKTVLEAIDAQITKIKTPPEDTIIDEDE